MARPGDPTNIPDISGSPQLYARLGGVFYLVIIVCGLFGEAFSRGQLVIPGDAAATAHKIMASEFLFRRGIAGDLIMHLCDIPLTLILYILLKPVSKDLSLLAALFSLLQTAILGANKLNLITVLLVLGNANYLSSFSQSQREGLASLSLALHEYGFGVGLLFFGVSCVIAGTLIFRSGYLPRSLGILQALAGVCYLINSFALLLAPAIASKLFPAILVPAFVGELATCLWLMVKGIDMSGWNERTESPQ